MKKAIDTLNIELSQLKDREKDVSATIAGYKETITESERQLSEYQTQIAQLEEALKRIQ